MRGPDRGFRRAAGTNFTVLVAQLVARTTSVAFLVILGPAAQGAVGVAQLITFLGAGLLGLGLQTSLLKTSANPTSRADALSAMWTTILWSVVVTALVALALFMLTPVSLEVTAGLLAVSPQVAAQLTAAFALGTGRSHVYAVISVGPYVLFAAALAGLEAANSLTQMSALTAFAVVFTAGGVLSAVWALTWGKPSPSRDLKRSPTMRLAIQVFPGGVAQLANYRFDQVLIASLLSSSKLGLYAFAVSAAEIGALPGTAIANILLPRMGADARAVDRRQVSRLVRMAFALSLVPVPFVIMLITLGIPRYDESVTPYVVLALGAGVVGGARVASVWLAARGRGWASSRAAGVSLVVTLIGDVALVPTLGIVGASIASTMAYLTALGMLMRQVHRAGRPCGSGTGSGIDRT